MCSAEPTFDLGPLWSFPSLLEGAFICLKSRPLICLKVDASRHGRHLESQVDSGLFPPLPSECQGVHSGLPRSPTTLTLCSPHRLSNSPHFAAFKSNASRLVGDFNDWLLKHQVIVAVQLVVSVPTDCFLHPSEWRRADHSLRPHQPGPLLPVSVVPQYPLRPPSLARSFHYISQAQHGRDCR